MAHDHDHPSDNVPADLLSQMGYETRDITPNSILIWVGALFVFITVIGVAILGLESVFVPETGQVAYESEFYRTAPVRRPPGQPQLQTEPKRDIIMYRRDEKRELDGYTVTSKGTVTEPVDTAIDAIAAEGISGVTEGAPKPKVDAYPGSGIFSKTATAETEVPTEMEAPKRPETGEATVASPPGPSAQPATEGHAETPHTP